MSYDCGGCLDLYCLIRLCQCGVEMFCLCCDMYLNGRCCRCCYCSRRTRRSSAVDSSAYRRQASMSAVSVSAPVAVPIPIAFVSAKVQPVSPMSPPARWGA